MRQAIAAVASCLLAILLLGCSTTEDCSLWDVIYGYCEEDELDLEHYSVVLLIRDLSPHEGDSMTVVVTQPVGQMELLRSTRTLGGFDERVTYVATDPTIVQVWIDDDRDGTCDPPPADRAWLLELDGDDLMPVEIDDDTPLTATCP